MGASIAGLDLLYCPCGLIQAKLVVYIVVYLCLYVLLWVGW